MSDKNDYKNKNGEVLLRRDKHSDGCRFRNGRGATVNATENFTHKMQYMVEELALGNLALRPKEIWLQISNAMNS